MGALRRPGEEEAGGARWRQLQRQARPASRRWAGLNPFRQWPICVRTHFVCGFMHILATGSPGGGALAAQRTQQAMGRKMEDM